MRKLFYFTPLNMDDCIRKGNISYLRLYECFFDRNYIIYCNSETTAIIRKGKTVYIGIGGCKYMYFNILMSPVYLFFLYKRVKPSCCITTDVVYSFWTAFLLRFKTKILAFPVFFIEAIFRNPSPNFMRSKFIENLSIRLSLLCAYKICIVHWLPQYESFYEKSILTKGKLLKLSCMVEEFPTSEFINKLSQVNPIPKEFKISNSLKLVTISRLYKDKLLDDAINSIKLMIELGLSIDFFIIGAGVEERNLKNIAHKLGIKSHVHFMGAINNVDLVPYLQHSDIYLSTLSGTSVREAILCEVPIVGYKNPMTEMYSKKHGRIGFITEENLPKSLAYGVKWFVDNKHLHSQIKNNIRQLKEKWSLAKLKKELQKNFSSHA